MRQRLRRFVRWVKRVGRWIIGDWYEVRKVRFPHSKRYEVYNAYRKIILETRRLRIDAQEHCDDLNYWGD